MHVSVYEQLARQPEETIIDITNVWDMAMQVAAELITAAIPVV